ncbi:hypothetical protein QR680_004686 [Steinernema hermaphroditum]|uniref:PWI domain-containing protein n=1 Tax=Steinernema hermaphroditum TaxID=289476 RepID=A0AA39HRT1_9BILA|nr:hypothetical protein QR680_004686 [Steinernema hermaphroditum]
MAYRGGPASRFGMMAGPGFRPPMPPMGGMPMPFTAQPQFFVQPPHVAQRPGAGASAGPGTFDNKPPVTTVFVGNICDKAEDELVKSLLQECGPVSTWKRIQGPNGRLQAFGFCEFDHPDGTLRALRVLNDFQLGNKKLVVKVEDKTKALIREFLVKRREAKGLSVDHFGDDLPVDEDIVKDDDVVKERITKLIESSQPDLLEDMDDGELPDKDDDKDKDSTSSKRKDHSPSRRKRSRSRSRSVDSKRRKHRRSRSKDKKSKRRRSESGSRSSSRDSSTSSRKSAKKGKSDSRSRRDREESEDSDDARERRALKKKLKEKEQSYLARLKKWESRERRMAKHYERDEVGEANKQKQRQSEIKKLKQFLEDYDDDRDDQKYFNMNAKGSTLYSRKRLYEREREQDAKDRQREQEEIEELKKAILEENKNIENIDEEAKKRHQLQEEEAMRKHRADSGSPNPHITLGQKPPIAPEANGERSPSPSGSASNSNDARVADGVMKTGGWATLNNDGTPNQNMSPAPANFSKPSTAAAPPVVPSSNAPKPNVSARLNGVFGVDDDEDDQIVGMTRKKPLKPFEITQEDRMQAMTAEERKKMIRDLIERIPTQKDDLFAYPIEWAFVDEDLVKNRIRPWVSKKILEYIGEEEQSLVEFVCEKVSGQSPPQKLLRDIAMVLDEEAEIFVVKMWRLLIYESESKRLGIPAKSSNS